MEGGEERGSFFRGMKIYDAVIEEFERERR